MKFVDEASIEVTAGRGGDGSASFRREKYIPKGGPDGGDGGRGGSIYLVADSGLNTLVDFRHAKHFKAKNGEPGRGKQMSGAGGEDVYIRVPLGTQVRDAETGELLGDMTQPDQQLRVVKGGQGGIGNVHFKSSTNRAPRQFTPGEPGEQRQLQLELKVLADVGLLGFPNAGKSTLISAISSARPKVADYPFTTLYPNLGVVRMDSDASFVVADIPGIISGAAEGVGLGIQFLKHLQRTALLLHLVDLAPLDQEDPADQVRKLEVELAAFSEELMNKPRWLVFTKVDALPEEEAQALAEQAVSGLDWEGPWFMISSVAQQGLDNLTQAIMQHVQEQREMEVDDGPVEMQAKAPPTAPQADSEHLLPADENVWDDDELPDASTISEATPED